MASPTGRSGKSLNFFLNLYDGMSKPVEKINKAYDKMGKIFSNKWKGMKNSVGAFSKATQKGVEKTKSLAVATSSSLNQMQADYMSLTGKMNDSLATLKDTLEDFLKVATETNDLMISLNKNVGLVSERSEEFHKELLGMAIDYRATFSELREILEQTQITQFRNEKQLTKFVEAVNMLSVATGVSRGEAAAAFETYTQFYKGSYDGFLRLGNVIRFTTANTKLAQQEALGLLGSFTEVVKNLPQKYRAQAAKEVLAIGGAAKEAEINLGDLERSFAQITDKYNEQGLRLRAFLAQNTKASIEEVNKMAETGNFTKIFELMAHASKNLSEEQFKLMRQDFEALTGMSFDMARQLREFDTGRLTKTMEGIKKSAERTDELWDAFEKAKASMRELWKDLRSSLTPFLSGVFRPILLKTVEVLERIRPEVQEFGKWLTRQIPIISAVVTSAFSGMYWIGEKLYELWMMIPEPLREFIKTAGLIGATIVALKGIILPVLGVIGGAFVALLAPMLPLIIAGAKIYAVFKAIQWGMAKLLGVSPETLSFFKMLEKTWGALVWVGEKVVSVFKWVWSWVETIIGRIRSALEWLGLIDAPSIENEMIKEGGMMDAALAGGSAASMSGQVGKNIDYAASDAEIYRNMKIKTPPVSVPKQQPPKVSVTVDSNKSQKTLESMLEELKKQNSGGASGGTGIPIESTGQSGEALNGWGF